MDSLATAIKNQHSFNKMVESHISQLALNVPLADKGKIPGQPDELEFTNLVDIYNAGWYHKEKPSGAWTDENMTVKKGDLGRPVIPIAIGPFDFKEALCDYGASVNIMPKVIYDKINGEPLLHTSMYLQLADQRLCRPEGILEDVCVWVGWSYLNVDFVVVETGGDERAHIILGHC